MGISFHIQVRENSAGIYLAGNGPFPEPAKLLAMSFREDRVLAPQDLLFLPAEKPFGSRVPDKDDGVPVHSENRER